MQMNTYLFEAILPLFSSDLKLSNIILPQLLEYWDYNRAPARPSQAASVYWGNTSVPDCANVGQDVCGAGYVWGSILHLCKLI